MTAHAEDTVSIRPGRRPLWVLLLQRGAPDVLYEAAAMTASAVSMGLEVTLVWFDAALEELAAGRLDAGDASAEAGTLGAAGRLLFEARDSGHVRMLACSASAIAGESGRHRRLADRHLADPRGGALLRLVKRLHRERARGRDLPLFLSDTICPVLALQ